METNNLPTATKTPPPHDGKQPEPFWDTTHINHSRVFKYTVIGLAELIILIGVFSLGVNVGFHKAGYTYSWISNYPKNFGGPGGPMIMVSPKPSGQFLNAHGVDGTILSVSNGSLIIKDEDSTEKTILVSSSTPIRENSQTLSAGQLKTSEEIVVIGDPNDQGQIQARFIRVLGQ